MLRIRVVDESPFSRPSRGADNASRAARTRSSGSRQSVVLSVRPWLPKPNNVESPQLKAHSPARDTGSAGRRWLSVGNSDNPDSRRAGAEAATAALTGADPKLMVVFCTTRYDPADVLAAINETSGGVPLIGCSMAGGFTAAGAEPEQVLVTVFGGPGFTVSTAVAAGVSTRHRDAGAETAGCVADLVDPQHAVLLMLTDGLAGHQEEIIGGAYQTVGASVPLVGGVASPGPDRQTFLLHGDKVLTDVVVGAAIGSDAPFGIGVRHGWRKVGEPMIVTRVDEGRVYELDGKPALAAYLKRHGAPAQAYVDPVAFDEFARTRPVGVRRRSGEEVRNISSTEFLAEGWLGCNGQIPEGGLIWLMEGDVGSVLGAADEACEAAIEALDGEQPTGFLVFDCVSRGGLLGTQGRGEEVRRLASQAGAAPVAGFYTWGEIARIRGINGLHHQTLVVLAVG